MERERNGEREYEEKEEKEPKATRKESNAIVSVK